MARDYRRGSPARPTAKRKQGRSCIWWFLSGALLGAVVSGLYSARHPPTETPAETARTPGQNERPAPVKPSFRFEEILRDTEVEVGSDAPPPPPPARPPAAQTTPGQTTTSPAKTPPAAPATTAPRGSYVVQVGSFRRMADAERLKAELALLGVTTRVQAATLANGRTTHRVRTDAFASKAEAERIEALLRRHGKDSMKIPVK